MQQNASATTSREYAHQHTIPQQDDSWPGMSHVETASLWRKDPGETIQRKWNEVMLAFESPFFQSRNSQNISWLYSRALPIFPSFFLNLLYFFRIVNLELDCSCLSAEDCISNFCPSVAETLRFPCGRARTGTPGNSPAPFGQVPSVPSRPSI